MRKFLVKLPDRIKLFICFQFYAFNSLFRPHVGLTLMYDARLGAQRWQNIFEAVLGLQIPERKHHD